ncbi:winged helix-turn-helix transcriptional regulator [Aminobacter anthyllidis]|uniref:Winged helix-turn-helix transcriptional regulator n=1 Tax=Aminobacter anthyllidis TaxID=1035067 RepID=A0A9X1A7M0_9HYPH|nr:MarR family winged helix-turn-helix transcriptional regulator [Aminobacter anthyllidis]MBT1154402.1 winged helix-turn-helix transcriptional regulator [Aminobacter anthyllidis]
MSNNLEFDARELNVIIRALKRFSQFDHKMQVSTILTLLEIALAERNNEEISVQDIEKRVGLQSGTASRNTYYWGEGHRENTGGHEMINIGFAPNDRRKRTLRLTNKGKAFINDVVKGVTENG